MNPERGERFYSSPRDGAREDIIRKCRKCIIHSIFQSKKIFKKTNAIVVRTTIAQPISAPAPFASPSPTRSSRLALRARRRRRVTPKGRGVENCLSKSNISRIVFFHD